MFLDSELMDEVHPTDEHHGPRVSDSLDVCWLVPGRLRNLELLVTVAGDGNPDHHDRVGVRPGLHPLAELIHSHVRESLHPPPDVSPLCRI